MNFNSTSEKSQNEQTKIPAKKASPFGLFAGMNIKKKVPEQSGVHVNPVEPINHETLDVSSNSKNQSFSVSQTQNLNNSKDKSEDLFDGYAPHQEKEAPELPKSAKSKTLPFFRNNKASPKKMSNDDSHGTLDVLQGSTSKEPVLFSQSNSKIPQSSVISESDKGPELNLDILSNMNNLNQKFQAIDVEKYESTEDHHETQQKDNDSIDFLNNSNKKNKIIGDDYTVRNKNSSQIDLDFANNKLSDSHILQTTINEPEISTKNHFPEIDHITSKNIEAEPQTKKKGFGFIKKEKETVIKEIDPNKVIVPKWRTTSEDQQIINLSEANPNDNSYNEYSNTLDNINKELSQISEKDNFKDDNDKTPDSKEWIKNDSLFNTKKEASNDFSEKIKREFKIENLDLRMISKFEGFLSEIFKFIKAQNGRDKNELEFESKRSNLLKDIYSLEKELTLKLSVEDYLAAEAIQQKIDTLNKELDKLEHLQKISTDQMDSKSSDVIGFDKLKSDICSELNKLMGDKIFIKEKKIFFQESQKEILTKQKDQISEAKTTTALELSNIRNSKEQINSKISKKEDDIKKETLVFQSQLDEFMVNKAKTEAEIEELKNALMRKENELFTLNQNILKTNLSIDTVMGKFLPQLKILELEGERENEFELEKNAKLEDLSEQERYLISSFENFEEQLLNVDKVTAFIDEIRDKYRGSIETFEHLFLKLTGLFQGSNDLKKLYMNKRKDYDSFLIEFEKNNEELLLKEKEIEQSNTELEQIQNLMPEIDLQKKAAVKDKNFSLANFHSKEYKRLEQLEVLLKEELKKRLINLSDHQKNLPLLQAKLSKLGKNFSNEKLSFIRSIDEILKLRLQILTRIVEFNPKFVDSLNNEILFCSNMIQNVNQQEIDLAKSISTPQNDNADQKVENTGNSQLNDSFIESKTEINGAVEEENSHKLSSSVSEIKEELNQIIKNDNEEEAWGNYINLYYLTKTAIEKEEQLEKIIANEEFEAAVDLQKELDLIEKQKKELQLLVSSTSIYMQGSDDEMKKEYVLYVSKQIEKLEASHIDKDDLELELINARLKKYKEDISEIQKNNS
jgi:hypothetical protein